MVNITKFLSTFHTLSKIGWDENSGMNRLALSENDIKVRKELIKRLKAIDANIKYDDAGNVIAKIGNKNKTIALGSHLDSVPHGGRFDGAYGVIAGLSILEDLKDEIKNFSLELVDFTNEEGSRWTPSLMGSGLTTGVFSREFVYSQKDRQGITFEEALKNSGFLGEEKNRLMYNQPDYYLELHIEQGPILEREGFNIGIPVGIVSLRVLDVIFKGESNQAGPTPMSYRKDALIALSKIAYRVRDYALKRDERLRITIGVVDVKPNVYNAIPGEVHFTIDIRSYEDSVLESATAYVTDLIKNTAEEEDLEHSVNVKWTAKRVNFDKEVIGLIEESCKELNLKYKLMWSWAGHDAQYMTRISRVGMIFVPSVNGRSHTKEEFTKDEDLINGLKVLELTVRKIDERL
ncbi:M20 family metallo-hydrolase [Sulfurisphaera ohwakuensis]|uniref:M20 family metallo-hydrolase n=1 Tax=Sulfurisphaera ohwakuensis TaxID=69656 RepID=UPI0036F3998F